MNAADAFEVECIIRKWVKNMKTGTSLFVKMWSAWKSKLPKSLVNEDPDLLIRLLELCSRDAGVQQAEAQREIGVRQPRLSKLMKKLLNEKWITVGKSEKDGRVTPMKATKAAQKWLSDLQERLSGLGTLQKPGSARSHRRTRVPKPEMYSFLDDLPNPNAIDQTR